MSDELRRRLRALAGAHGPARPLHLDAVAARAGQLDHRTRVWRITAAGLVTVCLIAVVATLARRNDATRVAVIAPPVASTTTSLWVTHGHLTTCPGTLTITVSTSPDALPAATSHSDDPARVRDVVRANAARIRSDYTNVVSVDVGPGGGYVWDRTSGGSIVVRAVTNYGISVRLQSLTACPSGSQLYRSYDGIPVTFVYVAAGPQVAPTITTIVPTTTVLPAKPGDVDGDGIADTVTTTADGSGSTATVVADLSRLGRQTVSVATTYPPAILGIVDVDKDGYSEIFVQVDQGASTAFFTVIKLVNGRLTQVTLDGQLARLALGGSVMHISSLGCTNGHLIEASWNSSDQAQTYQGELDVYGFSGSQMVLLSKTTHTFVTNGPGPSNAQLAAAGYLQRCPPID